MDAVRKAYQRAVQIPTDNVKKLWEEYQDFENGLNRITVRSSASYCRRLCLQGCRRRNSCQTYRRAICRRGPY